MPEPYYEDATLTLLAGDAVEQLRTLPDGSVNCVVTSPPYYGLRDYGGNPGQIGLENTPTELVARLVDVFAEVRRALADDGTLWLNIGDSYASKTKGSGGTARVTLAGPATGSYFTPRRINPDVPDKNLIGIPWRTAFALQDDGWTLRNAAVWHKPNAMPESVRDRLSCRYEHVFLLTKSRRYHFDLDAIREPLAYPEALTQGIVFGGKSGGEGKLSSSSRRGGGHRSVYGGDVQPGQRRPKNGGPGPHHRAENERGRNPGDVWTIPTRPLPEAHFAAFPIDLPRRCILAGCPEGGTVLDPFSGAGTTAMAAQQLGRKAIGIDINPEYHDIALRRMSDAPLPFEDGAA
jgi:DNA modification methylase